MYDNKLSIIITNAPKTFEMIKNQVDYFRNLQKGAYKFKSLTINSSELLENQ